MDQKVTAKDLRTVPTESLQKELKERARCVNCGTTNAEGWVGIEGNRVRCTDCDDADQEVV